MDYVLLWFVLTGATGYTPPLDVRTPACGKPGLVVGLLVDRLVNPTLALWPDPRVAGEHCEVDISAHVRGLATGEYHLATTEVGTVLAFNTPAFVGPIEPYVGIDPHTSARWRRELGEVFVSVPTIVPANFRLTRETP